MIISNYHWIQFLEADHVHKIQRNHAITINAGNQKYFWRETKKE